MRIGRNEIIEELAEHIRRSGGEPGEWRVGTASHDGRFKIQDDRENPVSMTGLAYREAHTPYAAADAVDYLVSALGLQLDSDALHGAERGSALQGAPEPGRLVFIYRQTPSAPAPPASEHAAFPRRAA
jgi:hypothetical protein